MEISEQISMHNEYEKINISFVNVPWNIRVDMESSTEKKTNPR